jgi:membrane protein required for colicin V production
MNSFDAAIYVGLVIAMITGFNIGLIRSVVTIFAYVLAAPIAAWAMSALSPPANGRVVSAMAQNGLVFFGVFLFVGIAFGKLARMMVDDATGQAGLPDRLCGAILGAARVGLIAVTIVAVFDRLVPTPLHPQWLAGSKLRPWLSAAGQQGLNSLPPELIATIDRLKRPT